MFDIGPANVEEEVLVTIRLVTVVVPNSAVPVAVTFVAEKLFVKKLVEVALVVVLFVINTLGKIELVVVVAVKYPAIAWLPNVDEPSTDSL